jgi:hypothetical protein
MLDDQTTHAFAALVVGLLLFGARLNATTFASLDAANRIQTRWYVVRRYSAFIRVRC